MSSSEYSFYAIPKRYISSEVVLNQVKSTLTSYGIAFETITSNNYFIIKFTVSKEDITRNCVLCAKLFRHTYKVNMEYLSKYQPGYRVIVGEEGAKMRKLYVKNIDMKSKQDMWEEEIRQCCAG